MRVISNRRLVGFASKHPEANIPLQIWRKTVEAAAFDSFGGLKRTFGSVDRVGVFYVFDVGGNKFRLIAAVHFNTQKLFVRQVLTHKEYDRWEP